MTQKISPFIEGKYGWEFGESGWNTGMDENLLKFSFLFDGNVDSIVPSLPTATTGQSHFLTTDNRLYFSVNNQWYSSPTPKWHLLTIKTTGEVYRFDGTSLTPAPSVEDLDSRVVSLEASVASLGSAAYQDSTAFATPSELDIVSSQANSYTDEKVASKVTTLDYVEDLRNLVGESGQSVIVAQYSSGNVKGGGVFSWKASSTAVDDGGVVFKPSSVTTGRWVRQFSGSSVEIEWFGAVNDTDAIPQLIAARDYLSTVGGGVIRAKGRYLVDSGNLEIDSDNIWVIGYGPGNTVFERTSTQNGFAFWWARNANTQGGGMAHCELIGTATNATGNGGVAFGYDSNPTFNRANAWWLENVVCRRWSQYGVGINSGDDWVAKDIWVFEHGITSANLSSCIAFYVYPKASSSNGKLYNIHAVINPASEAVSNGAALKLQTHSNLLAEMLYAKGGAEQCVSIDSISGTVRNLTARANGAKPGVAVLNYNSAHSFTGKFILDGVDCYDPLFSVSFVLAAAASGETTPRLKGLTFRNVKAGLVRVNSRSAWQDCSFENFYCMDAFRLDHGTAGVTPPELPITGNKYSNIYARSIEIAGDSGEILDCASTGNQFLIYGSNNTADNIRSIKSTGNGIAVEGSNNTITNLLSRSATGRKLWIKSGDLNIFQGVTIGGTAILNSGTNTNTVNVVQI